MCCVDWFEGYACVTSDRIIQERRTEGWTGAVPGALPCCRHITRSQSIYSIYIGVYL